jgi:hypothetical protein
MSSSIKLSPVSPSSASPPSITTSPPPPTTTQQQNITTSISMDSPTTPTQPVSTNTQQIKESPTPAPAPIITINPSSPNVASVSGPALGSGLGLGSGSGSESGSRSGSGSGSENKPVEPNTPVVPVSAPTPSITETIIKEVKSSYGKNSLLISGGISLVATLIIKLIIDNYSPNSGWLGILYLVLFFILVFGLLYYFMN